MSDEEYQILKAVSGEEAIEKAKTLLPDLIIMDVVLPDIDGADAIKVLQESLEVQDIPALFLSSIVVKDNEDQPTVKVCERTYNPIAKPINFDALLDEIKKQIG